ncbi:hypothetical protein [Lactonifactor longoviformis]|nr:hypothetical protein [Lactonifactor longoviformis]
MSKEEKFRVPETGGGCTACASSFFDHKEVIYHKEDRNIEFYSNNK